MARGAATIVALIMLATSAADVRADGEVVSRFPALARTTPSVDGVASVEPLPAKGGTVTLGVVGSFDSLNPFAITGLASGATQYTLDAIAVDDDQPGARRCLVCAGVQVDPQSGTLEFDVRSGARFHDGSPITAADVAWTIETLRDRAHPFFRSILRDVLAVEALEHGRVIVRMRPGASRDLPLLVASLPVQSRAWWSGRDIAKPSVEAPLGSGPYRIVAVEPHRNVVLKRVDGYWGGDLPFNRGRNNFDSIRLEYYRDHAVAREAFLAGEFDVRFEPDPRAWPRGYSVPAVAAGAVRLIEVPEDRVSGMTGFVLNARHPVLADRRVREALVAAFDFDWVNRAFYAGRLKRTTSHFNNGGLGARGRPGDDERDLLLPHAPRLPPGALADEPWSRQPPFGGDRRSRLAHALARLREAGLQVRDTRLTLADGLGVEFEIMLGDPDHERLALALADDLRRLGIVIRVRTLDSAQYQRRLSQFDFDITFASLGQSELPGAEQRLFWTGIAADTPGSENLAGVRDAIVDQLVERIVAAPDRDALVAATRALDRVLLWGFHCIPFGHTTVDRVALWDRFGMPARQPRYGADVMTWWIDPDKASRLAATIGR